MLSKTLDVAIGMAFLYLLVSLVASAIVELIATWRSWRGKTLGETVAEMFKSGTLIKAPQVMGNPLIKTLSLRGRPPSYIPASTFSAAVIDELMRRFAPPAVRPPMPPPAPMLPSGILSAAGPPGNDALRALLATTIAMRGDNFQAIAFALEKWFNDSMARTTGVYKRRTQKWLFALGLVFAVGCNINTVAVAQWLWKGDNARQAVVTEAMRYAKAEKMVTPPADGASQQPKKTADEEIKALATTFAKVDQEFTKADWPIGWGKDTWQPNSDQGTQVVDGGNSFPFSVNWLLQFIVGALISAIAISLGSSFWFDALQSLIKIRGTGPKP